MPGRGLPPKPSDRRARRNKKAFSGTVLTIEPAVQPELPDGVEWHPLTVVWWAEWGVSPLSETFSSTDWSFLLDTALLHTRLWDGDLRVAGEVRLRVAKMGATPEDRARLQIQFAQADAAEEKRSSAAASAARARRGPLKAVK